METILRKCKPEDVDMAVPLIYSSGVEAFEYVFKTQNTDAHKFLKFAFQRKGGEFSYQNHYALVNGSKIIGVGAIFNAKDALGFLMRDAQNILSYYGFSFFSTVVKGLRVENIIKPPKSNQITLAHIGIKEEYKGKGYGTELLKQLMKINKKDTEYFVLDVSEENPRAKALYLRLGFVEKKHMLSTLKNEFSYVPNHFRMILS